MKSDVKKIISIDCNSNYLGFTKPIISPFVIENFGLKEGEVVIGYEDDLEWEGVVKFDKTCPEELQWYLDLDLSKECSVNPERDKGRSEGAKALMPIGELIGEIEVVTKMLRDGMDVDLVMKYTRLSRTRVNGLKQRLENAKNGQ